MPKIDEIIETFQSLDPELRPEVLLDYANKLPACRPSWPRPPTATTHGCPNARRRSGCGFCPKREASDCTPASPRKPRP